MELLDLFPHHYSNEQLISKLRPLLARKHRLSARIINECRTVPSAMYYLKRFGSLNRVYELTGYRQRDITSLREKTRRKVTILHTDVLRRLKGIFGSGFKVVRERENARARILRFCNGINLSVVICLAEKTLLGSRRWRFQSLSARRHGYMTLVCRCNATNSDIRDFYLLPSVSHLPMGSLLKEGDERLKSGRKLRGLPELYKIINRTITVRRG